MTAEQLEELLGKVTQGEWEKYEDPDGGWFVEAERGMIGEGIAEYVLEQDATLISLAPSLARRVLAAEKLVEALSDAVDAWDDHNKYGDMMQGHWVLDARDALTAYREASK